MEHRDFLNVPPAVRYSKWRPRTRAPEAYNSLTDSSNRGLLGECAEKVSATHLNDSAGSACKGGKSTVERKMPLPVILAMFLRMEGKIKAFAIWKGERIKRMLERKGCLVGGQLDYHDLVAHAWLLLSEDKARTFASDDELLRYFTGQISGAINNIRRSARARYMYFNIAGAGGPAESTLVITEDDELLSADEEFATFERAMALQSLGSFVAAKDLNLLKLLELIADGIQTIPELALLLDATEGAVYRMMERLKRLAEEFGRKGGKL